MKRASKGGGGGTEPTAERGNGIRPINRQEKTSEVSAEAVCEVR